jgi:hypothetical protein
MERSFVRRHACVEVGLDPVREASCEPAVRELP